MPCLFCKSGLIIERYNKRTNFLSVKQIGMAAWFIQFFTSAVIVLVILMLLLPGFKTLAQDKFGIFVANIEAIART